jgi:alkaline phosphatase
MTGENLNIYCADMAYWLQLGQQLIDAEISKQKINKVAKNIVFFLGDGMSIPTVMAARIYKGQKDGKPGEETDMTFDKFPYIALSRVSSFI